MRQRTGRVSRGYLSGTSCAFTLSRCRRRSPSAASSSFFFFLLLLLPVAIAVEARNVKAHDLPSLYYFARPPPRAPFYRGWTDSQIQSAIARDWSHVLYQRCERGRTEQDRRDVVKASDEQVRSSFLRIFIRSLHWKRTHLNVCGINRQWISRDDWSILWEPDWQRQWR